MGLALTCIVVDDSADGDRSDSPGDERRSTHKAVSNIKFVGGLEMPRESPTVSARGACSGPSSSSSSSSSSPSMPLPTSSPALSSVQSEFALRCVRRGRPHSGHSRAP